MLSPIINRCMAKILIISSKIIAHKIIKAKVKNKILTGLAKGPLFIKLLTNVTSLEITILFQLKVPK